MVSVKNRKAQTIEELLINYAHKDSKIYNNFFHHIKSCQICLQSIKRLTILLSLRTQAIIVIQTNRR